MAASPLDDLATTLEIPQEYLLRYGRDKAKVDLAFLEGVEDDVTAGKRARGKLVLVSAITPTPAGEGKTTTSIGLADALRRLGKNAVLALREPSMGPVFGMKGGATGGGRAILEPEVDINLHFTGDFAAIAEANNLLAAAADNAVHFGTTDLDPRTISIRRAIDMNDRALRSIVVGLGGRTGGVPRESGFDITAASPVMAAFCLAGNLEDLRTRLGRIVVGYSSQGEEVSADTLGVTGAMVAILKDAFAPNLVRSAEGTPAFVHGGPFANIAHGCNSVVATRAAMNLGEIAITEAGFGADLGAEKFFDIVARTAGLSPDLTVVVATVRALKMHGGVSLEALDEPNVDALRAGIGNLKRHVQNLQEVFSTRVVVAINEFPSDTPEEVAAIGEEMAQFGVPVAPSRHFMEGGKGGVALARLVLNALEEEAAPCTFAYESEMSIEAKALAVVQRVYHGASVSFSAQARKQLRTLEEHGWGSGSICIAKTQYSFSTDPKALGAPEGFDVPIREVRLSAGAGFVVLIAGAIMTMPGLPRRPSACDIDVSPSGEVTGMH